MNKERQVMPPKIDAYKKFSNRNLGERFRYRGTQILEKLSTIITGRHLNGERV